MAENKYGTPMTGVQWSFRFWILNHSRTHNTLRLEQMPEKLEQKDISLQSSFSNVFSWINKFVISIKIGFIYLDRIGILKTLRFKITLIYERHPLSVHSRNVHILLRGTSTAWCTLTLSVFENRNIRKFRLNICFRWKGFSLLWSISALFGKQIIGCVKQFDVK